MRVLIVGAGIGGLAAAAAMRQDGFDVTVIERAPELSEVGAGVVLGPHAMRALTFLGADKHIRALNTPPEISTFSDVISGDVRFCTDLGETGANLYGTLLYTTHRRDLIDALAAQLGPADVRLNSHVVDIESGDANVRVHLANGETIEGDMLIGADGLRSSVRTALFGQSEALFTGFLAWRTVMPAADLGRTLPEQMSVWLGSGRHVIAYPIRHGKQIYAAFYVPANEIHREDWSTSGDVTELRASFSDACQGVQELAAAVSEAFITGIYFREPLPVWSRGRTLLLGDAAHPVLPTSGSGAGVALEDAVTLAGCMRRHKTDLPAAFAEFEARRKPRTSRLLSSSRADLTMFHESNPVKIAASGPMSKGIRKLDATGYQRLSWLYGYDEVAESEKPFEEFNRSPVDLPRRPEAQRAFNLWKNALRFEDSLDGWVSERVAYTRFVDGISSAPENVTIESVDCNGVPALRVIPDGNDSGPAVLHLHGGAYVYGSARSSVDLAARIARSVKGWALIPDYRLAPEHSAADMLDDVASAYAWLAKQQPDIFVSGECAGGGLAVRLAQWLRDQNQSQPLALYLLSPFVNLALTSPSIDANQRTEPYFTRLKLLTLAGTYIQELEPTDPSVSPIHADMSNLAPMRIFAAAGEALADDARSLADAATAAGTDARLELADDSVHSFALFDFLPETQAFLHEIKAHAISVAATHKAQLAS